MPKERRSSRPPGDSRPAFARPPGAPSPDYDDDQYGDPRTAPRNSQHRDRRKAKESPAASPADRDRRRRHHSRQASSPTKDRAKYSSGASANSGSHLLSADALSKLNAHNQGARYDEKRDKDKRQRKEYKNIKTAPDPVHRKRKRKNRDVSGAVLEEGRGKRHNRRRESYNEKGAHRRDDPDSRKRRKRIYIFIGIALLLLAILIPVAVVVSNKNKGGGSGSGNASNAGSGSGNASPSNTCDKSDTPADAKGTYTDISTWMDTTDFNCTFTDETVGNLSVMGLYSEWDDSAKANDNVPALKDDWEYGKMPIRGVNIGGWLVIEPFITPSLFNYPASANVVDEYTLTNKLGSRAANTIESHYASFISKDDFQNIRAAGFDHISWRYLLRAIEWCRENGLRVNLDLHSVPGSQNGWTHSGRLGSINWISGPQGSLNAQRSLEIHEQLATFFSQPRYSNIITIYGLVNEPKMIDLPMASVVDWNTQAVSVIRKAGLTRPYLPFGDGFLKLSDWQGEFQNVDDKLVLDTHQYQIFNTGQLPLNHSARIALSCSGYTGLLVASNNPQSGWGPTMDGEWSQADTDCAPFLNNVGVGSRWTGTLNFGSNEDDIKQNYKQFLQMYAEAQMDSFEKVWGWFYWTWKTENAVQWSWMLGLQAGILPEKAYASKFKCGDDVPDFSGLSGSARR
ncbi:putative glucan 1,3-beta-glucosidase D [Cyphellophora attinorum]|uniref:glucan 1,3-beta-glucosidase n=1 Tax=Cyphellophora attinorum TaxID=1664694 RepID=A0A0N1P0H4_9EURO|nr:putative glucan 1,3-beta-glucosidase D [Phialophora attinorum]KPI40015.1 putative glucan 1,3-beta-glucosidase D [Phialophora attinorum]